MGFVLKSDTACANISTYLYTLCPKNLKYNRKTLVCLFHKVALPCVSSFIWIEGLWDL